MTLASQQKHASVRGAACCCGSKWRSGGAEESQKTGEAAQFSLMHVLPVQVPLPQHTCSSWESAPSRSQPREMDGCCQGTSFSLSGRCDPPEPGSNKPSRLLTPASLGSVLCRKTVFSGLLSSFFGNMSY